MREQQEQKSGNRRSWDHLRNTWIFSFFLWISWGYQRNIVGIWNMACLANFLGVDISNIEDIEELTKMEDRTNLG